MRGGILQVAEFPALMQALIDERYDCWREPDLEREPDREAQVRGILTRGNYAVPAALIERLPGLRIIANCGVGYDLIAVDFARARGIVVTNTPDVLNAAVAELCLGLLLSLLRQIPAADRYVRDGHWARHAYPLTTSLAGKRIGIVGLGRMAARSLTGSCHSRSNSVTSAAGHKLCHGASSPIFARWPNGPTS